MQISSNYSMNGVTYENRCRQNDIPQFSTERAKQENESINPYMADTDFNEKAFDMIGPNAPQDVKGIRRLHENAGRSQAEDPCNV